MEVDSSSLDKPGPVKKHANPYFPEQEVCGAKAQQDKAAGESIRESKISLRLKANSQSVVRLPSYEQVVDDPVLYAHASRVMHLESNPGNAVHSFRRMASAMSG